MLLPLRFPRLWLALGWSFVGLAIFFCLVPGGIPGTQGVNDKFMHVLGYVALTLWFAGIYPRSRYWLIALSFLALGIAIEIAQGAMHMGRNAELRDVYADAAGIILGLGLALMGLSHWAQRIESWVGPRG